MRRASFNLKYLKRSTDAIVRREIVPPQHAEHALHKTKAAQIAANVRTATTLNRSQFIHLFILKDLPCDFTLCKSESNYPQGHTKKDFFKK